MTAGTSSGLTPRLAASAGSSGKRGTTPSSRPDGPAPPSSRVGKSAKTLGSTASSGLGLGRPVARADLPTVWLLAVREAALDDLGVLDGARGDVRALRERYQILRTFFNEFADEASIDRGVPIRQVRQTGVLRIRAGDRRAAVWYDAAHGVVWLCRVLAIPDFSDEASLYRRFGALERDSDRNAHLYSLLPGPLERRDAGAQQHLEAVVAALVHARDCAYDRPNTWQTASLRTPAGTIVKAGRAYVDREAVDATGELVTRFVVVLDEWPAHLSRPGDWREYIVASCFAPDEDVMPAYRSLPVGTNLRPGELPLVQERLEVAGRSDVSRTHLRSVD